MKACVPNIEYRTGPGRTVLAQCTPSRWMMSACIDTLLPLLPFCHSLSSPDRYLLYAEGREDLSKLSLNHPLGIIQFTALNTLLLSCLLTGTCCSLTVVRTCPSCPLTRCWAVPRTRQKSSAAALAAPLPREARVLARPGTASVRVRPAGQSRMLRMMASCLTAAVGGTLAGR